MRVPPALCAVLHALAVERRVPLAGGPPHGGIQPELEAFAVDVVAERLHPRGEPRGVGLDRAVRRPLVRLPAVVDGDIFVSDLLIPCGAVHAGGEKVHMNRSQVGGVKVSKISHPVGLNCATWPGRPTEFN
jgi:hypothetical protein